MADAPSSDDKEKSGAPAPEVLKPQEDKATELSDSGSSAAQGKTPAAPRSLRRGTYRPSHKATFLGIAVVVLILAINVGVIGFVLKSQATTKTKVNNDQVTINQSALNQLGVNRGAAGDAGVQLTVGPSAKFNNKVQIAGDLSVAGQFVLNSKFTASDAALAQLEAGKTALQELNVNGNTSLSNAALRGELTVTGASHFQGAVTMAQLLTVNNGLNVSGSMAVGGTLTVANFHTSSLVIDNTTTFGGHVITRGLVPGVSKGGCLSAVDTVSVSGNDMSGTVGVNVGAGGATCGTGSTLVNITFRSAYGSTPHVVVTPVGDGADDVYVNRSGSGFSIGADALSAGGHAFDYIVQQ
jgi:hypothetical protein